MSVLTQWGYTITDRDSLPVMMSVDDFNVYTGDKYAQESTDRIEAEIGAACGAIRNFVGWHLYPSASCEAQMTMQDRRVTRVGCDMLIQLPAKFVTAVESVTVNGVSHEFTFETNGLLRVYDVSYDGVQRYSRVIVTYTAGLTDELMAPIQELIAHRVTHSVAVPSGITSEASGGVSVTYNAAWINNARATALPGDNKEMLTPYRVQGVF